MWSDIETSKDLLGYTVHAALLKDVVSNQNNLPITIGLYGNWGCGKSSILKILKDQLEKENDSVVVYFDGWSFESFDDAKMALIQGIVDALEKNERFFSKVGDKASDAYKGLKKAFKELRKSIGWMRVLKFTVKSIGPIATASYTGGASLIPMLIDAFKANKENLSEILTGERAEDFLRNVFQSNEDKVYEAVREFRADFEKLIAKSKQRRVVILIDDLDRCLPRHIIDNLEAIKLFLNVPGTAFIIAADRFIVSNAIKSEYKTILDAAGDREEREKLGEAYMEKFIQLPYNIPTLSRKEVETYVTLLFCQSFLPEKEFESVQSDFQHFIQENKFDRYAWENVKMHLSNTNVDTKHLGATIGFVSRFSNIIGQSLRWNPRLIKRFLNAYEIRESLLKLSGLADQKTRFALLKLMLLEQQYIEQYKQLNSWVMNGNGAPKELLEIENYSMGDRKGDMKFTNWNDTSLLDILSDEPLLSSVNLKDLFWVSRDNIIVDMNGISLIPSRIRTLFTEILDSFEDSILIGENIIKSKVLTLTKEDQNDLFNLLDAHISTTPKNKDGYIIYCICDKVGIDMSFPRLKKLLSKIDVNQIPISVGNRFKDLVNKYTEDNEFAVLLNQNKKLIRTMDTTN